MIAPHPLDVAGDVLLIEADAVTFKGVRLSGAIEISDHRHRSAVAERADPERAAAGHDPATVFEEVAALLLAVDLTDRQRSAIMARARGETFEAIGVAMGVTKQAVIGYVECAWKKIARAAESAALFGLSDVYRAEVDRGQRGGRFMFPPADRATP